MDGEEEIELKSNGKLRMTPEIEELERISDSTQAAKPAPEQSIPEHVYPDQLHLAMATVALMVAVLLVALDVHILGIVTPLIRGQNKTNNWEATATPKITTEFDSLLDLTWYGGAFLLCQIALQPTYARLYQVFPIKRVFLVAIVILETGSIIGANAPSSRVLIVGRAIQGTGAGGVISGGLLMIQYLLPRPKRPLYLSFIATMYAVAAVVGPILGGVFAESRVTWRFCFWLNLPIGFITCALIMWAFTEPVRSSTKHPLWHKIKTLDPFGAGVLISWVTCLLLALQRASIPQPWSHSGIWGPLLAFGILFCIFGIMQFYQKDKAIIPYRILCQRTVAFSCLFEVSLFLATTTIVYYLPFYFQSVKGFSPHQSGIHILPFVVTNSAFAFAGGITTSKTGIYVPFMWVGAALMTIGCGLLYTLNMESGPGPIVGYQLIASAGYGLCVQVPFTAIQILGDQDIAIGNGLLAFFQGLGGALAVSAAQTIFSQSLHVHLAEIPNVNADVIISFGATNFVSKVPAHLVHAVRAAYGTATRNAFILPIIGAGMAFLASLGIEWRRHYTPEKKAEPTVEAGVTSRRRVVGEHAN